VIKFSPSADVTIPDETDEIRKRRLLFKKNFEFFRIPLPKTDPCFSYF